MNRKWVLFVPESLGNPPVGKFEKVTESLSSKPNSIFDGLSNLFSYEMTPKLSARVMLTIGMLATTLALPSRAAEKLPSNPKLIHRQLAGGYTLGLEAARRQKTFFFCVPDKTNCISRAAIGWRKPFIVSRAGGAMPGYDVVDTSSQKPGYATNYSKLPSYLRSVPLHPPAVAWEKLSPTRPLW